MYKRGKLIVLVIGVILLVGCFVGGLAIGLYNNSHIVSTKQIEPYKVVLTKVEGKLVRTFYYKQQ